MLTYDYADMKDLDFETALNTQNGSIYTQIVDDGIHTISSGDALRGVFRNAMGVPYYLNNYWFSMQRDITTNPGDIEYDESSAFALVSNDSLPYYLELSRDFQAEKANLEASDIATFYQPYLDDMFYVSGASASDVNFVTYEYRLACQDASYVEIAVNLPNEYYRSDSSQRFIGFFDLDTNKSIQTLLPNEIVQDLEKVYVNRDEGLIGCQDMKHFRLLQLKEYTPFERDAIIEELKTRPLYQFPRLQKSYYEFSDDYNYPS